MDKEQKFIAAIRVTVKYYAEFETLEGLNSDYNFFEDIDDFLQSIETEQESEEKKCIQKYKMDNCPIFSVHKKGYVGCINCQSYK